MAFEFFGMNNFNFSRFGSFPLFPMNCGMPSIPNFSFFSFQPQLPTFFNIFQWNTPINMPPLANYWNNTSYTPIDFNSNIFANYQIPTTTQMPDYTQFNYMPVLPSYTPITNTFDSNNYFKMENTNALAKANKISSTQKTDLKEIAQIYNQEKGIKLANEAIAGLRTAQKGYCARAVKSAISDAGLGAYESGNANDIPDILRKNSNFKEVKVKGSDLAKLPAGCVIAYDKGAAGYSRQYGHVEIKGEGNQAISFFVNDNIKPSDNVTVFVPV